MPTPLSRTPGLTWWSYGLINLAVVIVITLGAWYALSDPTTSPLDVYPLPFNAALFWALLFVVWSGFNLEFSGFNRLPQPLMGFAILGSSIVFGIVVTYGLSTGLGHFNADFSADRADGTGYFTGALFVLFGFSTYVLASVSWAHWPWIDLGLRQPLVGLCEVAFMLVPTLALYIVLGIPAVSETVRDGSELMGIDTLLGWYYSLIVAIVLTGSTMENWPWRRAGTRARVALVSTLGNIALGTALYLVLLAVCKAVIGTATVDALGGVIHQFPSQLGVCWVAWMIVWANAFGNRPTAFGEVANFAARAVITFSLALGTFVLYYYVLAEHLLHEPAVAGRLHGNALGFMDLFALVALLYVVGFGSYPFRLSDQPTSDHEIRSTDTTQLEGAAS